MGFYSASSRFFWSRSGVGLMLYLALCALLAASVGWGFYYSSLSWFKQHKSQEEVTALRLVDAFVANYSSVRKQFGGDAPVPATFRAHSIDAFNARSGGGDNFHLRWVGRAGRQIATPPSDDEMARAIEEFAAAPTPKPESGLLDVNGDLTFRTLYPSLASEQSCVDCHNRLQPEGTRWRLNDVMGAFAIDTPVAGFLHTILVQSIGLSCGLFLALAALGAGLAILQFRHMLERETAAAEIGRAKTFLDTIIENMPLMITVKEMRTQRYTLVNRAAERIFDFPREEILGRRPHDILPKATADLFVASDKDALNEKGAPAVFEHHVATGRMGERVLTTTKLPIKSQGGAPPYILSISEDITERKRAEEQVVYLARHDALTSLPNRAAFLDQLESTLARARASAAPFAVLCLNLDRFKEINDLFGHAAGDAALRECARRLQAAAEASPVTRLGGDEFAIILADGDMPASAEALASRLLAALAEPYFVEGEPAQLRASIGVTIYPADGADATALLANADAALDRAKSERGAVRFFATEMDQRLRGRRALQHELGFALTKGELDLHFQPQASIEGKIIGFEALLRWRRGSGGFVSPGEFIPLAEENGLIVPIGEWALRKACREAASWPAPLQIAVNLSPIQFRHGDLPGMVHAALLETGLSPGRLELEITEGVLLGDTSRALSILRRLKTLGVRIAMDDFGTGYSSLSYLQSFPFDKIKIDRAFISNLEGSTHSAAIVTAVIGLARGLGLPVLAEGVETQSQLAFLARESCDEVQGYLIGKPRPIEDYSALVADLPPDLRRSVERSASPAQPSPPRVVSA
jgi:diguanylate cyclase (GGDEF)-like protein/PAS domain S-box-containing protein